MFTLVVPSPEFRNTELGIFSSGIDEDFKDGDKSAILHSIVSGHSSRSG